MNPGLTLDTGGLIAFDRNVRRVVSLIETALHDRARITIPATVLAQAIRRPARQVRLSRLIDRPLIQIVPLDRADAVSVGRLLAASRTADIADAHVVICAWRSGQRVVTSDPDDLLRLDPKLRVVSA